MTSKRFYLLLAVACLAGYGWLGWNLAFHFDEAHAGPSVCLFKHATGLACPSCGSTRTVLAIFHGHWQEALQLNPLGFLLLLIMLVAPLWLLADYWQQRPSLFRFYRTLEAFLKQPQIAIPTVALVLANWVWNIYKGL